MINESNIADILMILKDAGIRRARIADCEFEFASEAEESVPAVGVISVPAKKPPAPQAAPQHTSGYSSLFGETLPRFKAE